MKRLLGSAALALLLPLLVPTAALAQTAPAPAPMTDGFTVDRGSGAGTYASVATPTADGGLAWPRSTSNGPTLALAPPAGQRFAAGTTFRAGSRPTADQGAVDVQFNGCGGTEADRFRLAGTVTVSAVTYDGDAVTSLVASYDAACAGVPDSRWAGVARFRASAPYAHGTLLGPGYVGSGVGAAKAFDVRLRNDGPSPATPAAGRFLGPAAADYRVVQDGCTGVVLPAGAGCDLTLTLTPSATGTRNATLSVPLDLHPRADGVLLPLSGQGVPPPGAPRAVRPFAALGGAGVAFTGGTGTYRLYRDGQVVATRRNAVTDGFAGTTTVTLVDPALAPGATAAYQVTAEGDGGEGARSEPVQVTRPAADPAVGPSDVLLLEDGGQSTLHDVRRTGATITRTGREGRVLLATTAAGARLEVDLPLLPGPGSYPVAGSPEVPPTGPGEVPVRVVRDSSSCTPRSGRLVADEVAYDGDGRLAVLTGELRALDCGSPWTVTVRWRSTAGYRAARLDPGSVSVDAPVGTTAPARAVRLENTGDSPLPVGDPTVPADPVVFLGQAPQDWRVVGDDCPDALPVDAACTVQVQFAPTERGTRSARLVVPVGTASGQREALLTGRGATPPGKPSLQAVPVLGAVGLTWQQPADDGSTGVTGYTLYRTRPGGTPEVVQRSAQNPYVVRGATVGSGDRWSVSATSLAGEGPRSDEVSGAAAETAVYDSGALNGGPGRLVGRPVSGAGQVVLAEDGTEHGTPAVSPDGTLLAYAKGDRPGDQARADLWLRRTDGTGTPVRLTSLPGDELDPAWSPDGRTVAFTAREGGGSSVRTVPATGGTPALRATGLSDPAWLPDGATLVVTDERSPEAPLVRLAADGTRTAVPGTAYGDSPAVSPDGDRLAFVRRLSVQQPQLALLPVAGAPSPVLLTGSRDQWDQPAWAPDGRALVAERTDGFAAGLGRVAVSGTAFGSTAWLTFDDALEPAYGAQGARTTTVTVTGSSVQVGLAAPAGLALVCALDGGAGAPCSGTWSRSGLPLGEHRLVVTASAPGRPTTVAARAFVVGRTPTVQLTAPTAVVTTGSSVAVTWRGTGTTYDVRYRRAAPGGGFGAHTSPSGWSGTTATSRTLPVAPGSEHCFSVRARGPGGVSAWTAERCTAVPLDDRSLTGSGWTRATASGAYRGTVTTTTRAGAGLSVRVSGRRVVLLATTCSACGQVDVLLGSTRLGRIDLRSPTTRRAVQKALPLLPSVRTGTLTVRAVTAGRTVQVDGVAVRRS